MYNKTGTLDKSLKLLKTKILIRTVITTSVVYFVQTNLEITIYNVLTRVGNGNC